MELIYLGLTFGSLVLWLAWHRATHGEAQERLVRIASARSSFAEVETSVLRLLASANKTRGDWYATATLLINSNIGPAFREAQILEEAIQQAQMLDRKMGATPLDVGQLSKVDLSSFFANLRLWSDMARVQQLAVDASQMRLEAFERASQPEARDGFRLLAQ